MKRYFILALIICLILSICACSSDTSETLSQESSSVGDYSYITPDTLELYISTDSTVGSPSEGSNQSKTMSSVVKEKAEDAGINIYNKNYEMVEKSDVAQKKSYKVLAGEYEFNYGSSKVYSYPNSTIPYYKRLDSYYWDDGGNKRIIIRIENSTDKVLYYDDNDSKKWSKGDIVHNEEEIRDIANKILLSVMSQDEIDKYVPRPIALPADFRGRYGLYYDKYIHGYQCDEVISIIIDQDKKIRKYDFENAGKFDSVEDKFAKEHIDAVANALQTKIDNTVNSNFADVSFPKLIINADGVLYVAIQIRYSSIGVDEVVYAKVG